MREKLVILEPQQRLGTVKAVRGMSVAGPLRWPAGKVSVLMPALLAELGDLLWKSIEPGKQNRIERRMSGITGNVKFDRLPATLHIRAASGGEGAQLQQAAVVKEDGTTTDYQVSLDLPARPTNLSIKLEGGDSFWSQAGVHRSGTFELPDLSEQVNAYLERIGGKTDDEGVVVPFLVETDGPGEIAVTLGDSEFTFIRTLDWRNEVDGTIRVDRNYDLDFGGVQQVEPAETTAPSNLSLSRVSLDVSGEFEPERLLGTLPGGDVSRCGTIDSDFAIAQRLTSETAVQCVGLAAMIWSEGGAELYSALHTAARDVVDTPGDLLAEGIKTVNEAVSGKWIVVRFDEPVEVKAQNEYWAIIKSAAGVMRVGLSPTPAGPAPRLNRGGGPFWPALCEPDSTGVSRQVANAALVRFVYLPGIDNQSGAVELRIHADDAERSLVSKQRLRPDADPATVSFDIGEMKAQSVSLELRSFARGSISLANVIEEYK